MNCQDCEMLMAEALGDELTPEDKIRFEGHLAECERCRRDYESARSTISAMRSLPGPQRVAVHREGDRLVIDETPARPPHSRHWSSRGIFRYAASVLISFTAGYGVHSARVARELTLPASPFVDTSPGTANASPRRSLQQTLVSAHTRNPRKSDLATCMAAMFPARQ